MGTSIRNWAEISTASNPIGAEDEDSTPDDTNFNQPEETDDLNDDDEIDEDGKNGGDEDDHDGAEIPVEAVFDLALRKTVQGSGPFMPGGSVTFSLEVINQGTLDATNVQLSDYIPTGLTLNDANWTETNGEAFLLTPIANLAAGTSTTVSITFDIAADFMGTRIRNWAEISAAENMLNLDDVDSTPDGTNFNNSGETDDLNSDDVVNESGKDGGDEDDHDPAEIVFGTNV